MKLTLFCLAFFPFVVCAAPFMVLVDIDFVLLFPPGRIQDHAELFFASLSRGKFPFGLYSSGDKERNHAFASTLKIVEASEGRIFSQEHTVSGDEGWRKNLSKPLPGVDLERVLLIDDNLRSLVAAQRRNVLQVPTSHYFTESARELVAEHLRAGRKDDAAEEAWSFLQYRNGLAYARGMLDAVEELSEREGITPVAALERLQWTEETRARTFGPLLPLHQTFSYYERGAARFREIDPGFELTSVDLPPGACDLSLLLKPWASLLR